MENNQIEIKKANRKALPAFILLLIIGMLLGGLFGYCAVKFGFDELSGKIGRAAAFFGINIAPWIMAALAVILPCVCVPLFNKAKKLLSSWDGEDESVSDSADEKLSLIIWLSGAALIISYFLITAAYSGGFTLLDEKENVVPFFTAIVGFFVILIETVIIQQKCVDAAKKMNPEKTASVYDMKFQKKWMDSCDEAEKIIIGKCAYKAYSATNSVCAAFAVLLALGALLFGTGFLPSLVVCVIWIINQSVYCREAMKYSKSGNKVS